MGPRIWFYIDSHWVMEGLEKWPISDGLAMRAAQRDFAVIQSLVEVIRVEADCRTRFYFPTPESFLAAVDIYLVHMPWLTSNYPWAVGIDHTHKDVPWYRLIVGDKLPGSRPFPPIDELPAELRMRPPPVNDQRGRVEVR